MPIHVPASFPSRGVWRCREPKLPRWDPAAAGTARAPRLHAAPWHAGAGEAVALGARRDAHIGVERPGAAPSHRLVLDIAASISNRISSQQLHFKAFHSAALME